MSLNSTHWTFNMSVFTSILFTFPLLSCFSGQNIQRIYLAMQQLGLRATSSFYVKTNFVEESHSILLLIQMPKLPCNRPSPSCNTDTERELGNVQETFCIVVNVLAMTAMLIVCHTVLQTISTGSIAASGCGSTLSTCIFLCVLPKRFRNMKKYSDSIIIFPISKRMKELVNSHDSHRNIYT